MLEKLAVIWRIYRYYNPIEDKSYIGQTSLNVNYRANYGKGYRKDTPFREAIDKYGFDNFEQSILRLCTSQEEADHYEQFFIDKYNSIYPNGYNLSSGGIRGAKQHNITRQRKSETLKVTWSNEQLRQHQSEVLKGKNTWSKGKHLEEEHKQKISDANKGENNPFYGQHHSEETKNKISDSMKGRPGNVTTLGWHWFNNGIKSVLTYECPEGFVPGKLVKKKCQ